jgi:hypothetical protein
MKYCVRLALLSLLVATSVLGVATSTMTPFRGGVVARVRVAPVPIRAELLEGSRLLQGISPFNIGRQRVGLPQVALFSGSFAGPVTWTLTTLSNGTQTYTVAGASIGSVGAMSVNRVNIEVISDTDDSVSDSLPAIASGYSYVGSVPEPSMLAMFGTGMLGVFISVRRNLLGRNLR